MSVRTRAISLLAIALCFGLAVQGVAQANTVGKPATDFTLRTHDGKKLTLSKLKGKRGAVLVFFATWCPPCMAEVPHVKDLVNATRDRKVLVYGVNIRQSQRIVDRFVNGYKVNYRVLLDSDAKVAKAYGITGIPTVVGIDADGVVRYRAHALPGDTEAIIKTLTAPLAKTTATDKKGSDKKTSEMQGRDYVKDGVRFISKETLKDWMAGKEKPLVIDVLSPQSYKTFHIKGAVNIPLAELRKRTAELDKKRKIVVYCGSYQCRASTEAAKLLGALGFKDVSDYKGGIKEWKEWQAAGFPVEKKEPVKFITRDDLSRLIETHKDLLVIDVLPAQFYRQAHIKGAINIPVAEIKKRASAWEKDRKIVVYCSSYSCPASTTAARELMALGFKEVSDYKGGIKEWKEAGLAVESTE